MPPETPRLSVFNDPPRSHVLLLSCMDTRLLDNTIHFMDSLNLQNRYDHVIFAGAAMGAGKLKSPTDQKDVELEWRHVFFHHLSAAIDDLKREIKDIFLLEHLDCGAYKKLHPNPKTKKHYDRETVVANLAHFHREEAFAFAAEIDAFCQKQAKKKEAWKDIHVHSLLMDLRGRVTDLDCGELQPCC
jgi:carbonic anhydrase